MRTLPGIAMVTQRSRQHEAYEAMLRMESAAGDQLRIRFSARASTCPTLCPFRLSFCRKQAQKNFFACGAPLEYLLALQTRHTKISSPAAPFWDAFLPFRSGTQKFIRLQRPFEVPFCPLKQAKKIHIVPPCFALIPNASYTQKPGEMPTVRTGGMCVAVRSSGVCVWQCVLGLGSRYTPQIVPQHGDCGIDV